MSNLHHKPVYVNGRAVGKVIGNTFHKTIQGSKHMLRTPRAIAFDVSSLRDAANAGAMSVQIFDQDTRTTYSASISCIREHGFNVDRGFGPQVALALDWWNVNGERAKNEVKAALTNQEIKNLQMGLFEVVR